MILDAILEKTRGRVSSLPPLGAHFSAEGTRSLSAAIRSGTGTNAIIGELKFASPTRGPLRNPRTAEEVATELVKGGCVGLSVLTEPTAFQGSIDTLVRVRQSVPVPVLRKDFIIDPRQVYETRAIGADAILLIAGLLGNDLPRYVSLSLSLGLEPLVEVHTPAEVNSALGSGAEMIGINNRDLRTMEVDLSTTERLAPLCGDRILVSMSGIADPSDIRRLRPSVHAFLIGSSLMIAPDPRTMMEGFVSA
jgi:indole-3-glycerol phosphate synthase